MRRHLTAAAGYAAGYSAVVLLERTLARLEEQRAAAELDAADRLRALVAELPAYEEACLAHGLAGCGCGIVQFRVVRAPA